MTVELFSSKRITGLVLGTIGIFAFLAPLAPAHAQSFEKPNEIQKKVEALFAETPVMVAVAKCESGFRQFYDSGNVFRGGSGKYIGVFQIDENLHKNTASAMGLNIYTVEGNLGYAKYLYERYGATPWKNCSNQYYGTQPTPTVSTVTAIVTATPTEVSTVATSVIPAIKALAITSDLKQGSQGAEVKELQKILNQYGYVIAAAGAGSPGNETENFGELTKKAVQKFQCEKQVVCEGGSGYGQVGPMTRAALQKLLNS